MGGDSDLFREGILMTLYLSFKVIGISSICSFSPHPDSFELATEVYRSVHPASTRVEEMEKDLDCVNKHD